MRQERIRDDYYKILELSDFASPEEIRIAYRKLALKNHPDMGGSTKVMQFINEAYRILSKNKERYDYTLKCARRPKVTVVVRQWHMPQDFGWTNESSSTGTSGF